MSPNQRPIKKTEQKKTARTLFIAPKPEKEIKKDYKIAIEVAGTALTDCCHDRLVSAALGKEDTPLEQWLANGPFSIKTFSPQLVTVYDETAAGGDLIVDENNILVGLVPCAGKRLIERHGAVVQVDAAGEPVKTIGEIGKPIRSPGPLKDTSGRFAHHRPGDADFGPPPGGSSTLGKYIGTGKTMEFWKEPDGSHLWITKDGILHDCHIVEYCCIKPDPVENHRLSRQGCNIYLTTAEGIFPLGRIGGPIQNREKLLVDRQDDPTDKNNKFRDWCEKPKSAYLALASAVFKPAIELDFSRTARPEVKYPEADPFKGYDFFAHIGIALPHFIEGKSLLFIEMWEKYDKIPCLNYAKRIRLKIAETGHMRPYLADLAPGAGLRAFFPGLCQGARGCVR